MIHIERFRDAFQISFLFDVMTGSSSCLESSCTTSSSEWIFWSYCSHGNVSIFLESLSYCLLLIHWNFIEIVLCPCAKIEWLFESLAWNVLDIIKMAELVAMCSFCCGMVHLLERNTQIIKGVLATSNVSWERVVSRSFPFGFWS